MRKEGTHRRLPALLLALSMLLNCAPAALAAETAAAMQLAKTEGVVAISNNRGRSVSLIEKMRLYSGYHVETEEASYAWIDLDSTKLNKLDALSEVEIRKSGKQLELLLNEGNIFFNVTEPMEDGESLNIRTSTIVVGIRGTCGWVKIIDQWTVEVCILEGTVTISVTDPVTGQTKEDTLSAGERARCVVYPQDRDGDKCDILRDRFQREDIDGFVLVELKPDAPLVEKIYAESGIDLRDWPRDPDEWLKEDQEEVRRKLEDIEKALEEQDEHISKDPVWPEEPSAVQPQPEEEPFEEPVPAPTPQRLMMKITDDAAQAHLASTARVYVAASPAPQNNLANVLEVDSGLSVPAGKTLDLESGIDAAVYAPNTLQVDGTMRLHGGSLTNGGAVNITSANTLRVGGNIVNQGVMTVPATGRVVVEGTFTNDGTITPTQGATIQARQFVMNRPVTDWAVSGAPDSSGYYFLVYVGGGTPNPNPPVDPKPPIDPNVRVTVIFEGNGGVWPDGSGSIGNNLPSGTPLQTALTDVGYPTRTGYTLAGWNTAADGSGTAFAAAAPITADVTLYAQWTAGGVTWRYDEPTQTLYIEGAGPMEAMADHDPSTVPSPWYDRRAEITTVVIGSGVTSIIDSAFLGCENMTGINIPDSVTSLGSNSFQGCTSLASIVIPDSITTISYNGFYDCNSLTSITLPRNLTVISSNMLALCRSLTSITVPDGVTKIEKEAFFNCTGLEDITIPASVGSIGEMALYGCGNLTNVYYGGTQAQWNALMPTTDLTDMYAVTIHCTDGDITSTTTTIPTPRSTTASPYSDVPLDAWYAAAVLYCRDHGLMSGVDATRFSPGAGMTRAMLVTVLHRLAGSPEAPAASFRDVPAGSWYAPAVSWAVQQGVAGGYGDGRFGPDDPVTRQQAAALLWRFAGEPDALRQSAFSDREAVDSYAREAVDWAHAAGILNGMGDGRFTPDGSATRAQTAAILMNYLRSQAGEGDALSTISAMDVMCAPSGMVPMEDGSFLVTDTYHKLLWKVRLGAGTVLAGGETTLGLYGEPLGGYNDASLLESFFKEPWAAAPFLDGWAVSDTANDAVRLVRRKDTQTLNGKTSEGLTVTAMGVAFDRPTGLAADKDGNLYVSDTGSGAVRKITPQGRVTTAASRLSEPMGLCWKNGALYIAEAGAHRVVKLKDGKLTTVAGSGEEGLADGPAEQAAFSAPQGVAVGDNGAVYVSDTGNSAVRMVRDGEVTTLAVRDVSLARAGLTAPRGLLVQGDRLYICDGFARKVFVLRLG